MQPITPLLPRQRANAIRSLLAVEERAERQHWTPWQAKHEALMNLMCELAESNLHNYGSNRVPGSAKLADKAPWGGRYMGSDHYSVGTYQQQPAPWGGWGSYETSMDPRHAAHKFMDRGSDVGVDRPNGIPTRQDIQKIQVSFDWTGWNYGVQLFRARALLRRYWDVNHKRLRTEKLRKKAKNWQTPK